MSQKRKMTNSKADLKRRYRLIESQDETARETLEKTINKIMSSVKDPNLILIMPTLDIGLFKTVAENIIINLYNNYYIITKQTNQ